MTASSSYREMEYLLRNAKIYDVTKLLDAMKYIHTKMEYRKHIAEKVEYELHREQMQDIEELFNHTKNEICQILGIQV